MLAICSALLQDLTNRVVGPAWGRFGIHVKSGHKPKPGWNTAHRPARFTFPDTEVLPLSCWKHTMRWRPPAESFPDTSMNYRLCN